MGFRATITFRKFKVALNPMYVILHVPHVIKGVFRNHTVAMVT